MSGRIPVAKAFAMMVVVVGAGYGIMTVSSPSDQQFYDSLAPDLKRKVDEARLQKKVAEEKQSQLRTLRESAENEKPVWASTPPPARK